MQVASKLGAGEKETIEKAVDDTIAWLDANQTAEKEEYEGKLKELENVSLSPALPVPRFIDEHLVTQK